MSAPAGGSQIGIRMATRDKALDRPAIGSLRRYFSRLLSCCLAFGAMVMVGACSLTGGPISLETQFAGMETCEMAPMYVDPLDQHIVGSYFTERHLLPCASDDVASFCVNDTFHGLPVFKIAIPYKGFSIYALYFDLPPYRVREVLAWPALEHAANGAPDQPQLLPDPDDPERAVLYCEPHQEP